MLPPEVQLRSEPTQHVALPFSAAIQGISAALPAAATAPLKGTRLRMLSLDQGLSASVGLLDGVMESARTAMQPGHGSFTEMLGVAKATKAGLDHIVTSFCPALAPVMPFLDVMHFIHMFKPDTRSGPGMINARPLFADPRGTTLTAFIAGKKVTGKSLRELRYNEAQARQEKDREVLIALQMHEMHMAYAQANRESVSLSEYNLADALQERIDALGYDREREREEENERNRRKMAGRGQTWCERIGANRARLDWKCRFFEEGRDA